MTARLLTCDPEAYHKLPGLSSSIAKTLITRSPLHAWHEHPAYGATGKDPTKAMDRGAVMHRIILGKGKAFKVLHFDDWRTNKAKEARDEARASGLVPILAEAYEQASFGAMAIMKQLASRGVKLDGDSEQGMEWDEMSSVGPVACRGMMDHLTADCRLIYDLKITDDASPAAVERTAENFSHGIQHAAYLSGHAKIFPALAGHARMLFIFAEPEKPYAINIVEPDGMFRELGERRWRRAVESWGRCVKANEWPAYGTGINNLSAPGWAMAREGYTTEER